MLRAVGAAGMSDSTVMARGCSARPSSMAAYLPGLWARAVTSCTPGSRSATDTTRNSCGSMMEEASTQMASVCGAMLKGMVTMSVRRACASPLDAANVAPTRRSSTAPLGKITESRQGKSAGKSWSRVTLVVVAAATRPPRRMPPRLGSATWMTSPGRTTAPSSPVRKVMISDSDCSEYSSHLPTRLACPREVQPMATTSACTTP